MDQIISKFQHDLLNRLKTCIGSKKLNLELEELLSISSNSAYKKMNGISPLSLEEIFIITQKYQLSVDMHGILPIGLLKNLRKNLN